MVMDLEGEMTVVPMPTQSSNYLHESSASKLNKIMAASNNSTPQQPQQQQQHQSQSTPMSTTVIALDDADAPAAAAGYDSAAAAAAAATATAVAAAAAAVAATMGSAGGNNNGATPNANSIVTTPGTAASNAKKPVRYRECQKNHAAGIGGHALDGCGEFMPTGEEGTIEALKCSACGCHRNFHRREVEGAPKESAKKRGPSLLSPLAAITPGSSSRSPGSLMALSSDQSEDQDGQPHGFSLSHHMNPSGIKKRFRTKFTNDQKEKMYQFADRLGWKIQKHDDAEVQQFCADVGVKRHVLKVWMHNNKNTYGKKL